MRRMLLMGCFGLIALITSAQGDGRVRSGTLLRWSMNGSIEVMDPVLTRYYGSNDTMAQYNRTAVYNSTAIAGNPNATRLTSVQALCHHNAVTLNWSAVQQFGADRYTIEKSSDGYNWIEIGRVPANQTELGNASYSFNYAKNMRDVVFRIAAVNRAGERMYSPIIESPCNPASFRAVTPNPVYSTATISIGAPTTSRVKLVLVNSSGTVVQGRETSLMAGINQLPVDLGNLPAGYYTLFIQWRGGRQDVLKLLKQ